MADEPMDNTSDRNGTSFTNKEMWVRVDGKLDVIMARQSGFDVELALLKASNEERKAEIRALQQASGAEALSVKKELEKREKIMDEKVKVLMDGQVTLNKALKWATAIVIGAGVLLDAAMRFFAR